MQILKKINTFVFILACASSFAISANEIIIRTPTGDSVTVAIDPEESFGDVMSRLDHYLNTYDLESYDATVPHEASAREFILDFMQANATDVNRKVVSKRNYRVPVTTNEKKDIAFIVTTLASSSWATLLTKKSKMEKAGDRVDQVHPLRFLMCVFTDEELKAGAHAIHDRGGKIWNEFFRGIKGSLADEAACNNLTLEFIEDFAKQIGIDVKLIKTPLEQRRWNDFIDVLMAAIPRGGNPGRYDM